MYNHNEDTREINEAAAGAEHLHFYYDRTARLARASKQVRALYEEKPAKRGFFRSLVDSKPKATLFTVIAIICILILFMTYLYPKDGGALAGNTLSASALRYGDRCFIVLKKERAKKDAYTGIVSVIVSPTESGKTGGTAAGGTAAFFQHSVVFTDAERDDFRWSIPLTALGAKQTLLLSVAAGKAASTLRIVVN